MLLTYGSNILQSSGRIVNVSDKIVLLMNSNRFPQTNNASTIGSFVLNFSSPTAVTINYGDGNVLTYNTTASGGNNIFQMSDVGSICTSTPTSYAISPYIYLDGLTSQRIVSIFFNKNLLVGFSIASIKLNIGDLYFEFAKYPNLKSFSTIEIGDNGLGSIVNLNLLNASLSSHLTSLSINSAFDTTSPYYTSIPLQILSMPLATLECGGPGFVTVSFAGSNMDQIILAKDTLVNLSIQGSPYDDSFGLPSNFNELTNLQTLNLESAHYTEPPSAVGTITSLLNFGFSLSNTITSLGDISGLTGLVSLKTDNDVNLGTTIPAYFNTLTSLKIWEYKGCGKGTPGKLDTFINNVYNFVVANAAITGSNSLPFRGMTFTVSEFTTGDGTEIPSGVLQPASGYVQGVSNGLPASSLEMIFTLINQYGHTWFYRTT